MASNRDSPDDDGYKRFTEDIHNVSYGSNISNPIDVDEMGSRSSLSRDDNADIDHWEMNYHEAAIFLEDLSKNLVSWDTLSHINYYSCQETLIIVEVVTIKWKAKTMKSLIRIPDIPSALPAYLLVHNSWYYGLDLLFSIVLLLLAIVEKPSVDKFEFPVGIHGTLELVALGVIGIELALKLRWIGWTTILRHKRTMVKSSHFRVTRALRPIFLVDTKACGAVRRYIRQILQSLPPILDMLVLLLFFVCIYSLLGFFLFGGDGRNLYFKTLSDSFVSMFVLLTTANFPDLMMPSYAISKWSAVFFISYISTVLYVLMNLMLAVVYETFTGIEKDKFRKLLLHKRQACKLAFRLLVSKQTPDNVRFRQFQGMMRYYSPQTSQRDVVLIFRQLNTSNTGLLTQDEFLNIYDATTLRWRIKDPPDPWFSAAWPPLRAFCRAARTMVTWQYFEHIVYLLIVANGLAMFVRVMESSDSLDESARNFCASWDTFLFLSLFLIEAVLRIIGLGWTEYISSGWNFFDLSVTLLALSGSLMILAKPSMTVVVILRPLSNSTVEDFYKFSSNSSTSGIGYYYLNNFSNLFISGVTLFELTVVNNWFIIMDAYASVSVNYSRVYFMMFYLFTMVVLTIVVASVLEAFRFRIQYKKQTSKRDEEQMLHEEVVVEWNSLQRQIQDVKLLESLQMDFVVGSRTLEEERRTRDVLQHHMYIVEISQWLQEAELEEKNDINNIIEEAQINARLISA
ncbi:hypothetical protein NQ314_013815 [Rhamnusium bicolor]|uniref:Ion transport domain-containing protein n=1 Tax=Rhamnusium bicolor TaxID=1586634 RepID=A0AAV8X4Z6_9CUCU|nr:hypothetical protein NQ314_013815 [Rhamnusium bicolor]